MALARRFLGYRIKAWSVYTAPSLHWYAWIESPNGVHFFVSAPTLEKVEALSNATIGSHLALGQSFETLLKGS